MVKAVRWPAPDFHMQICYEIWTNQCCYNSGYLIHDLNLPTLFMYVSIYVCMYVCVSCVSCVSCVCVCVSCVCTVAGNITQPSEWFSLLFSFSKSQTQQNRNSVKPKRQTASIPCQKYITFFKAYFCCCCYWCGCFVVGGVASFASFCLFSFLSCCLDFPRRFYYGPRTCSLEGHYVTPIIFISSFNWIILPALINCGDGQTWIFITFQCRAIRVESEVSFPAEMSCRIPWYQSRLFQQRLEIEQSIRLSDCNFHLTPSSATDNCRFHGRLLFLRRKYETELTDSRNLHSLNRN